MNINRRQALKTVGASTIALAGAPAVSARGHKCQLNWGKELSSHVPKDGDLVVNATEKVVDARDSGHGDLWAVDNYRRTIKMWDVGDEFVAILEYQGDFDAIEGRTEPGLAENGGDGTLDGDETGTFHGGYVATFTGDLLENPTWPTHGFVGTHDYGGERDPGGDLTPWHQHYLENADRELGWWGWVYRGGRYGTWVNASTKDCGNIS